MTMVIAINKLNNDINNQFGTIVFIYIKLYKNNGLNKNKTNSNICTNNH